MKEGIEMRDTTIEIIAGTMPRTTIETMASPMQDTTIEVMAAAVTDATWEDQLERDRLERDRRAAKVFAKLFAASWDCASSGEPDA